MTVATFRQPDFTSDNGTLYKTSLDAAIQVLKRFGDAFAAHEESTPAMTVRLDAGMVFTSAGVVEVAAQSTVTIVAPTTNPRIDYIVVDQATGVVSVITGAEAASPVAPAITGGLAPIATVLLDDSPATTSITNSLITDKRVQQLPGARTLPTNLSDANQTLTVADCGKVLTMGPSANRIIALPTTNVLAGDTVELHNLAATQKFTIEASGGADICQFQAGGMVLVANQATPTTAAHWRITEVFGGASPSFSVVRSGSTQTTSGTTKVKWNAAALFDTNGNFSVDLDDSGGATENRFTPTVPGKYLLTATVLFLNVLDGEIVTIRFSANGAPIKEVNNTQGLNNAVISASIPIIVDANGTSDYYDTRVFTVNDRSISGVTDFTYWSGSRVGG